LRRREWFCKCKLQPRELAVLVSWIICDHFRTDQLEGVKNKNSKFNLQHSGRYQVPKQDVLMLKFL
jgi:hypothetical protein